MKRAITMTTSVVLGLLLLGLSGCITSPAEQAKLQAPPQLREAQQALQEVLNTLNGDLTQAAQRIPQYGLDSTETRAILLELAESHPAIVDCCTINAQGVIVAMEPEAYQEVEGSDIHEQEQVTRLHATREPVLSKLFTTVEGFPAIDLEWPLFTAENEFIGSVSMLIRHTYFFAQILEQEFKGSRWDYWVMQTDGTIIYDPDRIEIGRNVFNDTIYHPFPDLVALAKKMASQPVGKGKYKFYSTGVQSITPKECYWRTIELHGVEWRLGAARNISGHLKRY